MNKQMKRMKEITIKMSVTTSIIIIIIIIIIFQNSRRREAELLSLFMDLVYMNDNKLLVCLHIHFTET